MIMRPESCPPRMKAPPSDYCCCRDARRLRTLSERSSTRFYTVASENSIHLTRSHRRIRTRSSDDCNRLLVRPYAVRLLQAATAAGSRNPNTAPSAQRPAAAHAPPPASLTLDL